MTTTLLSLIVLLLVLLLLPSRPCSGRSQGNLQGGTAYSPRPCSPASPPTDRRGPTATPSNSPLGIKAVVLNPQPKENR